MSSALPRGCVVLVLGLIAGVARAHPSPAEPPEFFPADCIIVVDKRAQTSWHLDYAVLAEDTAPEVDHISLPDSKTHQFFALSGTLLPRASDHVFLPFDDQTGLLRAMPTWLSTDDVMRAAAGVTAEDMTAFTADQVRAQDILENDAVVSTAVRPLTAGTSRVPITEAQAIAGIDWDLTDVPPGVYQIAAYIFSPPYNGWAVRPGLIKVIDGPEDASAHAAITLRSVAARVFAGQGRRIRGCVDAPAGSTLQLWARNQADVPGAFELRAEQDVTDGAFDLCLGNAGVDGALEIRVEVRTPASGFAATQSSDALSLFSNEAACVPSEVLCCPTAPDAGAGVERRDAAITEVPDASGAVSDAQTPGEPAVPRQDGSTPEPAAPSQQSAPDPAASASCRCRLGSAQPTPALVIGALLAAIAWLRRAPRAP